MADEAYLQRERDKIIVRSQLKRAYELGLVTRLPCIVCGSMKSEGHHPDYSMPYFVVFYCRAHHMREHARIRAVGTHSLLTHKDAHI